MKINKIEIQAGITTFLTMSYIIIVNPSILATPGTGMTSSGVLTATILISAISTILMGLYAKLPFALAPGMGLNTFFTFSLILGEKIPWQQALGLVFWSGIFFILISFTPIRQSILNAIPKSLRIAMSCGIGAFLCFIGFKNAMLLEAHPATFVTHAKFSLELLLAFISLWLIFFLLKRKNPASFLIGILSVTIFALLLGKISLPEQFFAWPDFQSVFFQLDILGSLKWAWLPSIITLIITDLFDSISTFIGVSEASGIKANNGEPKNIQQALKVDAIATTLSAIFGTSSTTTYIESTAGVESGGRTGTTAIVAGLCFLPFLFFSPTIAMIPAYATAPVLILVGLMMFKNLVKIEFDKLEIAIPCFLTIFLIPFTFSITYGILWGFFSYVCCHLIVGKTKEIHPVMYFLASLMLVNYFL